jgi:hypothetical protein
MMMVLLKNYVFSYYGIVIAWFGAFCHPFLDLNVFIKILSRYLFIY